MAIFNNHIQNQFACLKKWKNCLLTYFIKKPRYHKKQNSRIGFLYIIYNILIFKFISANILFNCQNLKIDTLKIGELTYRMPFFFKNN